jgi:hypothetical protein
MPEEKPKVVCIIGHQRTSWSHFAIVNDLGLSGQSSTAEEPMNIETGEIYQGQPAIDAALERGEPLVEVSPRFVRRHRGNAGRSQKEGNALAQLARTRPDLTPEEREAIVERSLYR